MTNITFKSNSVSLQVDGYERHLRVMEPISDVKFPVVLTPGTSYYLMKEKAPIIEAFHGMKLGSKVKVRALVQDAIVRPFYSPWVTVDLTEND